jgi:CRP-like cAMP-binding protein
MAPVDQATDTSGENIDARQIADWLNPDLDAAARTTLAGLGRVKVVPAGEVLVREGDPTGIMAFVIEGRVGLRMRVPERGQVTILTVEVGDVVGWSALVPPNRSTSTAVTLADTRLLVFDASRLRAAIADDAHLAAQFYPVLLKAVARRLEGTRLQLLDLFSQRWVDPW